MIKGAIFDMDGTLLDSMGMWRNIASLYLRSRGIDPPEDYDSRFRHAGWAGGIQLVRDDFSLPESPDEIKAGIYDAIMRFYATEVQPKPGTVDMLNGLRARGVRLAVATATPLKHALAGLDHAGLLPLFDAVHSTDENGIRKQDSPDVYMRALASIGTPLAQTAVFEDALFAARVAAQAGFPVAAVADRSEREQDALRALARWYLPTPEHWLMVTEE